MIHKKGKFINQNHKDLVETHLHKAQLDIAVSQETKDIASSNAISL